MILIKEGKPRGNDVMSLLLSCIKPFQRAALLKRLLDEYDIHVIEVVGLFVGL